MSLNELEKEFGRVVTAKELAEFLKIDVRTLKKYGDRWGGVEVTPGTWRFFEKPVLEVLNAKSDMQTRQKSLACEHNRARCDKTETVSRRQPKIGKGSYRLGKRTKKGDHRGVKDDPFGLLDGS